MSTPTKPALLDPAAALEAMTLACHVEDVPLGEGRAVNVQGHRIALFRTPHAWYAIDALCPHRGGPLADGIVCDRSIICPLHDRRFDLATGTPLSTGDGVSAHAVEVRGDHVYVTLTRSETHAIASSRRGR